MLQSFASERASWLARQLRWIPLCLLLLAAGWLGIPNLLGGLEGKYFQGTDFSTFLFSRKDRLIFFHSSNANYGKEFPSKSFSVRWQGELYCPQDGTYHFGITADGDVKFNIDDALLISSPKGKGEQNHPATTVLTKGWHKMQLEFFHDTGRWGIKLFWTPPGEAMKLVAPRFLRPPV